MQYLKGIDYGKLTHPNLQFGARIMKSFVKTRELVFERGIDGLLSVIQSAIAGGYCDRDDLIELGESICPVEYRRTWEELIDRFDKECNYCGL